MKKALTLIIAVVLFSSCENNFTPVEITATTDVTESVAVTIPQTSGTPVSYDETTQQDLNQVIANLNSIIGININTLNYKFKNVTGNTNAVIQSGSIMVNGNTVASLSDINIAQAATAATVFSITDTAVLDLIETELLSDPTVVIRLVGSALSDDGSIDFEVEFNINLTATFQ